MVINSENLNIKIIEMYLKPKGSPCENYHTVHLKFACFKPNFREYFKLESPCNQGTKIGIPKVFRRIPKNSSTNICGVPWNFDSYPPNTLAIREEIANFVRLTLYFTLNSPRVFRCFRSSFLIGSQLNFPPQNTWKGTWTSWSYKATNSSLNNLKKNTQLGCFTIKIQIKSHMRLL